MLNAIDWAERGLLPDALIRWSIRRLNRGRLRRERGTDCEAEQAAKCRFIASMDQAPIALHTQSANEQHYELPSEFFQLVLGRHLKYSGCYFPAQTASLDQAEISTDRPKSGGGYSAGVCSLWPAPNCGATTAVRSGGCRTIALSGE